MGRRGKRVRLARNVYKDASGIAGLARWQRKTVELRFPHGTPVAEIRRVLDRKADELAEQSPVAALGTVRRAVADYLDKLPAGAYQKDRKALLDAWLAVVGDDLLAGLTRAGLVAVIDGWTQAGVSASRINKRISALRVLWRRIAPDHAPPHAIERLSRVTELTGQTDRARDLRLVIAVLEHVSDEGKADRGTERDAPSLTKARLQALAWTAQPRALMRQVKPEHVRWHTDPPELYVQPRRKGTGVDAAWIPLIPPAVEALKHLFAIKAHGGAWSRTVLHRAWKRAIVATQRDLRKAGQDDDADRLAGMRVYDLRHSYLTALAQASGDIYAVAEVARHSDLRTTRRYMRGASSPRMKAGVSALADRVPRTGATTDATAPHSSAGTSTRDNNSSTWNRRKSEDS